MKKIIALTVALTVIISILNISAFATSEPTAMTSYEFHVAQADLIEKYVNGDITYSEWNERQVAVLDEYLETNKSVGDSAYASAISIGSRFQGITQKFNSAVSQWGDGARERVSDWWNSVCNSNNVPTETTQTSTIDMQGYGALEIVQSIGVTYYFYCDYIEIDPEDKRRTIYPPTKRVAVFNNGYISETFGSNLVSSQYTDDYKFYGDVRYKDGTQAPTDDEWEYGSIKKFDEMPEKDLENLLNDFSEEMERQNPDLSSIEGLLRAIYARMGTLDSDNDNDLLNAINANILALLEVDNKKDDEDDNTNEELVNTLLEIRDSLKNGTLGTAPSSHGHEISGTVYNVIPLDKNWINKIFHDTENLKVEYDKKVYYLEDCGCLKLGDKYYTPNMNYDSYSFADYDFSSDNVVIDSGKYVDIDFNYKNLNAIGLTIGQTKKVNSAVTLVQKLISQSIPYSVVTGVMSSYEAIIFNLSSPEDIVLTVDSFDVLGVTVGGFSVTIFSTNFFNGSGVSTAIEIIKNLLKIIIGYSWLVTMRRKTVSMLE